MITYPLRLVLVLAFAPATAFALTAGVAFEVSPNGTTYTFNARVASGADGDSVVVWDSHDEPPSGLFGIHAQRIGRDGALAGAAIHVNTTTQGVQVYADVGVSASGDFAVSWVSDDGTASDRRILARCFAADGNPRGGELEVRASLPQNSVGAPVIGMSRAGAFVVAWAQEISPFSSTYEIRMQRYAADCAPHGAALVQPMAANGFFGDVAMAPDGSIVLAWQTPGQVLLRRYDASGSPVGAAAQVNTPGFGAGVPRLAVDASGGFVVGWVRNGSQFDDIALRRYGAGGAPLDAAEWGPATPGEQRLWNLELAADDDGDFIVSWFAARLVGECLPIDPSRPGNYCVLLGSGSVNAQRYADTGAGPALPRGPAFVAAIDLLEPVHAPAVAADGAGNFLFAWLGGARASAGPSAAPVYARRYTQDQHNGRFDITVSGAHYDPAPVAGGPAGTYVFEATFCNRSLQKLSGLSSRTAVLGAGKVLFNRDRDGASPAPPGGPGSSRDFDRVGAYADGLLDTGECVAVPYVIGLDARTRFSFAVDVLGDPGDFPTGLSRLVPPNPPRTLLDGVLP